MKGGPKEMNRKKQGMKSRINQLSSELEIQKAYSRYLRSWIRNEIYDMKLTCDMPAVSTAGLNEIERGKEVEQTFNLMKQRLSQNIANLEDLIDEPPALEDLGFSDDEEE